MEDLKKLNKNKKMVKKLADSFDAFLASQVGDQNNCMLLAVLFPSKRRTWKEAHVSLYSLR